MGREVRPQDHGGAEMKKPKQMTESKRTVKGDRSLVDAELLTVYESLPKSESTIKRHGYKHGAYRLINDTAYGPCFYRLVGPGGEIGAVKYYGGRLLAAYGMAHGTVEING